MALTASLLRILGLSPWDVLGAFLGVTASVLVIVGAFVAGAVFLVAIMDEPAVSEPYLAIFFVSFFGISERFLKD